ncbi:DUF1501 domain-containing protein [Pseudobdellovibrio exovorus]|uniref:DUF1501 domain-containing protein n=1 Tax=Pseudobdellovibrio exovorus JSS TaxID=1184267 RepID=M4VBW0_9BACT|nr:DUF1501 domain-containing protein [Pseudobdellovibrio exovorus]AGH95496.1 hypothetical protein A11Q_1280 [Pseudobdellovibrio exovorus JSS]
MSRNNSRRKFLLDATKGLGLLGMSPALAQMVVQSIASQANANSMANVVGSDRIYLYFSLPGGPPRWLFDLPLTPNGTASKYTDSFSHNGLGTFIGASGNSPVVTYKPWYDSTSKYWLPPVWGSKPSGGKFTHTLSNAAFIRGVDLEINNHTLGRYRNQSPIIGGLSVAGVLAQKTGNPFPAVSTGSISNAFKAEKALSPIELNLSVSTSTNPVANIMSYFSGAPASNTLAVKQAFSEFDRYAERNQFIQRGLAEAKDRADALVTLGVKTFTDRWGATYSKYLNLVQEAFTNANTSLFVDNKAIPTPTVASGSNPDPRTRRGDGIFMGNMTDIRAMVNSGTSVANLATTFATVEILVTTGLTQVLTADIGALTGLVYDANGNKMNLTNDQHFIGSLMATLGTTYYYRAILNCTEELIATLKADGLFNRTVIQFGSEFNRNAKADGSGSDHGFLGGSALLISGMIPKTTVVGNIKHDTATAYAGTWGLAELHPLTNKEFPLRINDIAKTVCGMLNVRNVANNGVYVLKTNGSTWESYGPTLGEAKNVA